MTQASGKNGPWRIGVVTTSRADLSIYAAVLRAMRVESDLDVGLFVSGSHLAPEHGRTIDEIDESALAPITARIECLLSSDSEQGVAKAMGLAAISFAQVFESHRPDLLIVLGDRFEMHAAASSAAPFRIPLAHIHGGEETEGAFDNAFRHSITKLSHLHFATTELAAKRICAMGEDPDHVHVSGAPALDNIKTIAHLDRTALKERFGAPDGPFILVTFHPETLDPTGAVQQMEELLAALAADGRAIILTGTNADVAGGRVKALAKSFAAEHADKVAYVEHFGAPGYYGAMAAADLMVGNSSSGIIEAASFGLPVVNIGDRQKGREQSANIVDAAGDEKSITVAMAVASSDAHRKKARSGGNIYGDGNAAPRIVDGAKAFLQKGASVRKSFFL